MSERPSLSRTLALASLMAAVAATFEILPLDLKVVGFGNLSLDPVGIPILLTLMLAGLAPSVFVAGISSSVIFFYKGAFASGTLKLLAELSTLLGFYLLMRRGVLWASISALSARIIVMTVANYYLLQFFFTFITPEILISEGLAFLAVFNLVQGVINIWGAEYVSLRIPRSFKETLLWIPGPRRLSAEA
ncbi:MAG: hypothetical protein ACE5KH_00375 [Candidatus Geothermarchaeales archaeon]